MSYLVTPFEISSKVLAQSLQVRFVHLASGIATRHSDTIDCFFHVGGREVIVSIPCAALTELRECEQLRLTDQRLAEIASAHLRTVLERGYDATLAEARMTGEELRALAQPIDSL